MEQRKARRTKKPFGAKETLVMFMQQRAAESSVEDTSFHRKSDMECSPESFI